MTLGSGYSGKLIGTQQDDYIYGDTSLNNSISHVYGTNPTAIWLWDNSENSFMDYTYTLQRRDDNTVKSMGDTDDYLYIGFERRFDAMICWLNNIAEYSDLIWEFSTDTNPNRDIRLDETYPYNDAGDTVIYGSSRYEAIPGWIRFVPNQIVPYTFNRVNEYAHWDLRNPLYDRWESLAFSDAPDSMERYWIRIKAVGNNVEAADIDMLTIRPYASIASPKDVQNQIQIWEEFAPNSNPSDKAVEKFIRGAEDNIFYLMGKYYRPEFVENELMNFRPYGMYLRHRPVLDILDLSVHTGSYWEPKIEGRDQDWHYEPETGMIYVSTIFLDVVPPMLRRGYSERRNQGAFKRAVRIRYVHGHDVRSDPFGEAVARIITKQASLDILVNHDFARLLPQNVDRATIQNKIQLWRDEIEEFKGRYVKLAMW